MPTKFCWACSKKLWGNHKEELVIDGYNRTLHKMCAKEVKKEYDFRKQRDGSYISMEWISSGQEPS